jgi:hypothetical protein
MRQRKIFEINWREYELWEITVGLYWTYLVEPEQFFVDLFRQEWYEVPKFTSTEIEQFVMKYFWVKEDFLEEILSTKKRKIDKKIVDDFHIWIGKFMTFFPWNSYEDVMNIPLSIYEKLMKDRNIINWQEKYSPNRHNISNQKRKLKELSKLQ